MCSLVWYSWNIGRKDQFNIFTTLHSQVHVCIAPKTNFIHAPNHIYIHPHVHSQSPQTYTKQHLPTPLHSPEPKPPLANPRHTAPESVQILYSKNDQFICYHPIVM